MVDLFQISLLVIIAFCFIMVNRQPRRQSPAEKFIGPVYKVRIHFAHGIKTKLVLNEEQFEQLNDFLKQSDGFFEIGDDQHSLKLYREFICSVEVKKK